MQTNLAMQPKYLPKQTHKSASRPLRRPQVPPILQARARFEQTNFCRQSLSYCRQSLSTVDKVCHLVDVADELVGMQTNFVSSGSADKLCQQVLQTNFVSRLYSTQYTVYSIQTMFVGGMKKWVTSWQTLSSAWQTELICVMQTKFVKCMTNFACCNKLCHAVDKVCHM